MPTPPKTGVSENVSVKNGISGRKYASKNGISHFFFEKPQV